MDKAPARMTRRGFSLIELLVVVSIIGILAAMLVPAISMVMASARASRCMGNQRQLLAGVVAYSGENEGNTPLAGLDWSYTSWNSPSDGRWMQAIDAYIGDYRVFNCPVSAKLCPDYVVVDKPTPVSWGTAPRGLAAAGWICLYAYNTVHWGRYPDMPSGGPMNDNRVSGFLRDYDPTYSAARCPVVTDGVGYFDASKTGAYAYFLTNAWGCYFPHRNRQSTAFIDGHVKSSSFADFTIVGTNAWMGAIQVE